jgi:hypothetical protein
MNRLTRRTVSAIAGVVLGWYVAGVVPTSGPLTLASPSMAEDTHHAPAGHTPSGAEGHGLTAPDSHSNDHDGSDPALAAANLLVPQAEDIRWYKPVLIAIVGLFVAAVVLGIPALKLRGPEPPDPAADDHASH